jgi:type I restriction enzyme S subunit
MGDYTLSEIAVVVDCEHKTAPKVDYSEYYSIRTTNIKKGQIDFENANRVSVETYLQWSKRATPEAGDIIIAREAPVGEVGWIKEGYKVCLGQRTVLLKVTHDDVSKKYLLYYLTNSATKYELQVRSAGSVVSHLNIKDIRSFEVSLPSLPEQKAIASVLSSIDDKIDLLHRQNKTLEAIAETLFRQWFVEEAKEDWEEGRLGDIIELIYGKGLKQGLRTGKGYPVIGSSGVVGYHSDFLVEGPGIVIGRKGTLGKVIYLFDNFYPIDTTYYIKSKVESVGLLYEYFLLKTLNFEGMNSDSAVPGLNRDIALSTEIKIAPLGKLNEFNQFAAAFITKLSANNKQIRTLEKLRDTLLPKLMSGEIRVKSEK